MASSEKANPLKVVNSVIVSIVKQASGLEVELSQGARPQVPQFFHISTFDFFCLQGDTNSKNAEAAFSELFENISELKTKSALAQMSVQSILSDRGCSEYATKILNDSSSVVLEVSSLFKYYGELEYQV